MLKIAIIGSGSTYTPELIEGLINRKDIMPVKEIALMDIDSRKLNIVGNLAQRMVKHSGIDCKVVLTEDYDTALNGASFVFVQIRVGKLPARVLDEKIPLKHNLIGQETTGIGGFFKGLRTVPVMMNLAERMKKLCPDAWMLNFSNPAGICAQALLDHTNIKMLGLCNATIRILDSTKNLSDKPLEFDYVGLNHLSFLTSARSGSRDLLKEAIDGDDALMNKLDLEGLDFSHDVIRTVRGIPSYYMQYFFHTRKTLEKLKAEKQTRGEICIDIEEKLLEMYSDAGLYAKPEELSKRGGAMYSEIACSLAESVYTNDRKIHIVNAHNNGAIPYMAKDDVVEARAIIGANGAEMLPVKSPGGEYIQGIMQTIKAYERLTVKAALNGSRTDAIAALMANPLISDYDTAVACFDEMLEAHREFLPQF